MAAIEQRSYEGAVVHQAEGMISAQANVPIVDAVRLLNEYVEQHGVSKAEAAAQVVERRLHFR